MLFQYIFSKLIPNLLIIFRRDPITLSGRFIFKEFMYNIKLYFYISGLQVCQGFLVLFRRDPITLSGRFIFKEFMYNIKLYFYISGLQVCQGFLVLSWMKQFLK